MSNPRDDAQHHRQPAQQGRAVGRLPRLGQDLLGALRARSRVGGGLLQDRRGVVAMAVGITGPVLLMSAAIGFELSNWSVTGISLQRTADAAAMAGVLNYQHQGTPVQQTAAQAAANVAVLNGIKGVSSGTSPTWTSGTSTLVDGNVTVQFVTGPKSSADTAIKVTVKQTVPLYLAGLFTTASSRTMSAVAIAEIVGQPSGATACVVALKGESTGVTTGNDITDSGAATISGSGCTVVSDAGVSLSGSVTVNANIYAAGAINLSGASGYGSGFSGKANQPGVPDPFASNTALATAMTSATTATGSALSCGSSSSCTFSPGTYSSISVSGAATVTFNPGLYVVAGAISFSGSGASTFPAAGVTLVANGTVSFSGAATVTGLTAATAASAVSGAIPGVVIATNSSSSSGAVSLSGSAGVPYVGAIYVPNGNLSISGAATNASSGCSEVVAYTVSLSGSANFSSGCSSYGLSPIYTGTTKVAQVVQ